MKKIARLVAVLLCVCMMFTSCAPAGVSDEKSTDLKYSQEVQNLEKLCKVWGYTKYNHPAFLFGQKDWDEELLNLIPVVSEAKSDEVNDILHEWFVSLGEVDYGTNRKGKIPEDAIKFVQADTSWISEEYLGAELAEDLSQFGQLPGVNRSKAPVKFDGKTPDFSNEPFYEDMNYKDQGYRLLGLFRLWNAMEYNYPYLDILDYNWHELLPEYIARMLEGDDQRSYELTIASLSTKPVSYTHLDVYKRQIWYRTDGVLVRTKPHFIINGIGRQSVYQIKVFAADTDFKVGRQSTQKIKGFLLFLFGKFIESFQRCSIAVSVPVLNIFFQSIRCKIAQAHKFMVAKQHFHVGSCHDFPQKFDRVRAAIYNISQNVQRVLFGKVYLLKHCMEAIVLSMNV